jgi:hypothetical protein
LCVDASKYRFDAWLMWEQAAGPRGQGGAPAAQRGRTTLTGEWRLLRGSPRRAGWWSAEGVATRRDVVDRGTATLVFACCGRSASSRRWVPRIMRVRADGGVGGRNARGDQVCGGGVPARRGESEQFGADRELFDDGHDQAASAVISAHRKPASSRAIAVATTDCTFVRAAR